MNIIVRLKRLFRGNAGEYRLPDTSAWSGYLDDIKKWVKQGIKVVVTEGTRQELRNGYRKYAECKEAYDYITSTPELVFPITGNEMKAWPVDDQNVAIAEKYYNKGFDVTLVTCDKEQAHKARIRGLNVSLLRGQSYHYKKNNEFQKTTKPVQNEKPVEPEVEVKSNGEVAVPCITKGKEKYISTKHDVEVYSNKGKRRIGRENLILILPTDVLVYNDCNHTIQEMTDTYVTIKKM